MSTESKIAAAPPEVQVLISLMARLFIEFHVSTDTAITACELTRDWTIENRPNVVRNNTSTSLN